MVIDLIMYIIRPIPPQKVQQWVLKIYTPPQKKKFCLRLCQWWTADTNSPLCTKKNIRLKDIGQYVTELKMLHFVVQRFSRKHFKTTNTKWWTARLGFQAASCPLRTGVSFIVSESSTTEHGRWRHVIGVWQWSRHAECQRLVNSTR